MINDKMKIYFNSSFSRDAIYVYLKFEILSKYVDMLTLTKIIKILNISRYYNE